MATYVKRHVRKSGVTRREEILEATQQVLAEHGIDGTTMTRIAEASGLTPGALYRHFDSRKALLDELNKANGERAREWVGTSSEPNVMRRLLELGHLHETWARENLTTTVRTFYLAMASGAQSDVEYRLTFSDMKPFFELASLAEEGKQQGVIREDVEPMDVAWAVMSVAFMQDLALMLDAERFIEDGTFDRNLRRLLDSFAPGHQSSEQ
jgi:AcrR family transcriptional regulator